MKTLIAFSGRAKSGKDTCYRLLKDIIDKDDESLFGTNSFIRINFADALKEEVALACGVELDFINQYKDVFRPILQWWGTEFRRKFYGDDYWILKWMAKYDMVPPGMIVVCTDCRFPNEAAVIKKLKGYIFHVRRPYIPTPMSQHPSENSMESYKEFDGQILNYGSMEVLKGEVKYKLHSMLCQ